MTDKLGEFPKVKPADLWMEYCLYPPKKAGENWNNVLTSEFVIDNAEKFWIEDVTRQWEKFWTDERK